MHQTADTPSLHVAYEQTGPDDGQAILLLHGFPYDVRQFDGVVQRLARPDRRLVVPYLRGFGPTRYRDGVLRSGQQAALGKDVVDLLDALGIERATLVGYDWGARAACIAAALWPERVAALCSTYRIQDIAKQSLTPASVEHEQQLWYQWYFQTERGRAGLNQHRDELCERLWSLWSPEWVYTPETFARTAASFQNPDFVETVIHGYRHRYANAPGDPALAEFEQRLADPPRIAAPTIALQGASDRVEPPETSVGKESRFSGFYERRVLHGVGHCAPAEDSESVARAVEELLTPG